MERNKVYVGNNLDILKTFPDNSIDSVVTDPPYGLGKEPNAVEVLQSWITKGYHEIKGKGFMGKEWDAFVPQPIFWKEVYRVLKHGGYVLSFAGTRTYDWMVMGLRLAGFEIRDQIAWIYGSGFPKSFNISNGIEGMKKNGSSNKKDFKKLDGVKGTVSLGYNKNNAQDGFRPNDYNGQETTIKVELTTEEAKQWQGWGTALKPALEPIVMARKPLDGTVAQNVLKWGVGGINIDDSRVGEEKRTQFSGKGTNGDVYNGFPQHNAHWETVIGRFPANVIHDGSDEVVNLFPQTESGKMTPEHNRHTDGSPNGIYGKFDENHPLGETYGDSGSASRFFYTAKASQEERNFGLYEFEEQRHADRNKDDGAGGDNPRNRSNKPKKNFHPTVKPIDLMRYLVKLVTPKGGVCLDPFMGSGTTAVACKMEGFDYIGTELMPEYAEIAEARIKAVKDYETALDTKTIIKESIKEDKEKEQGIMNIFDFLGEEQ